MTVDRFYNAIPKVKVLPERDIVAYFAYYLTVELGESSATTQRVTDCFRECDLAPPTRIAAYFNEGLKSKPPRYVKAAVGYRLQKHYGDELSNSLGTRRAVQQTSAELRGLETGMPDGPAKTFLTEAIDCFEAGANRAAIIMTWVLVMHRMHEYVFTKKLAEFNAALAASPVGKLSKINAVTDFGDIRETRFIELCRTAGIITNDERKILADGLEHDDFRFVCSLSFRSNWRILRM